jgi:pilus assembly protein Flp/PilA
MRRELLIRQLHQFVRSESGATAIEYALIAGGISVAIIVGVQTIGTTVMTNFYNGLVNLF